VQPAGLIPAGRGERGRHRTRGVSRGARDLGQRRLATLGVL